MRILLTSPSYPPFISGLGNAVAQQAALLARGGHKVIVATGGTQRGFREEEGIRVESFVLTGADCCLQPIRGDVHSYTDFLLHNHWDVVLFNAWQNWATDLALPHLEDISGRKFVYSHCISTNVFYSHQPLRSFFRYLAWRPYWWRLPCLMKRLDGILFLAAAGIDSRFDDLRCAHQAKVPLWIVPNSLSPTAAVVLSRPYRPLQSRDRLMAVGSYHWQKGFDFVIRAYAASEAHHIFPLHFYGQKYSAYTQFLRSLARRLGLSDENVVFHAGLSGDQLTEAYDRAFLFLCGSHTECQPLVLLDANASGTPFVARNSGCIALMPGGVVVKSVSEMTLQINGLITDSSTWKELADAGRHVAQQRHHPNVTSQLLLSVLDAPMIVGAPNIMPHPQ